MKFITLIILLSFFTYEVETSIPVYSLAVPLELCDSEIYNECNDITYFDAITSVIMAEAGGEINKHGIKSAEAVLDIIYNRVEDKRFPNTVMQVLWQKRQFDGKFEMGYKWKDSDNYQTIFNLVLEYEKMMNECNYQPRVLSKGYCHYYNPSTATNYKFVTLMEAKALTRGSMKIGNHKFINY